MLRSSLKFLVNQIHPCLNKIYVMNLQIRYYLHSLLYDNENLNKVLKAYKTSPQKRNTD